MRNAVKFIRRLLFILVVKTGTCPLVAGLGPCDMNCTGDSKCPGKQKCCSNGCGLTCTDLGEVEEFSSTTTIIKTTPQTTNPSTTKPTTRPATIPTTTPTTTPTTNPTTIPTTIQIPKQPETVSLLSVTTELQENKWNTSLLNPRSVYYQSLYGIIKTNVLQLFRLKPGITDVFIQSFRSRNRVDLVLHYNTESIALIDIITKFIAARSSGAIHDLKIHQYMTFDTQIKPGDCPAALVNSGACLENCMGDGTCPGVEKCCSTGCGRVCTPV